MFTVENFLANVFRLFVIVFLCSLFLRWLWKNIKSVNDKKSKPPEKDPVYKKKKIMNQMEKKIYSKLRAVIEKEGSPYMIFPQVSCGEVISCNNKFYFFKFNSKRFDFLIVNEKGLPVMAIEYQGGGHYQNDWEKRDQEKALACEKAGIILHYIYHQQEAHGVNEVFERLGI